MGKITVKHYLNKDVKPKFDGTSNTYPLYVQIIANRVNYKMKSNFDFWDGYIKENHFDTPFIQNVIQNEKETIERVVAYLLDNNKKEFINADSFKKMSAPLWLYLNNNFWKVFAEEAKGFSHVSLPNAFYNATFYDIDDILKFTQSGVEQYFTEEYGYLRIGMDSLKDAFLSAEKSDLNINRITVFEFLFEDKRKNVLEAVYRYHGFYGGTEEDEEKEYEKVMKALERVVFIDN